MTRMFRSICITAMLVLLGPYSDLQAQGPTDSTFKPSGKVWGLGFGDFAFKANADESNRGGTNQYTGMAANQSMFQFRRVYLGYDYEISERFSSNFLLAMEDNLVTTASSTPVTSGDLLTNGRYSLFIKNANVTWKNIFKGSHLSLGMVHTPAAVLLPELIWDYRCIERTISELRRTPAWDMGVILSGTLHSAKKTEFGYNLMIGNGTASRPENNQFKWFYGDVYVKLFNKKLIIDLYADYNRMDLVPGAHHDRSMIKGLIAFTSPKFTIGIEAFTNTLRNDVIAMSADSITSKIDTRAIDYSIYARGRIYKDQLGFFVRYDNYDASLNTQNDTYINYAPRTSNYDPNTVEQFFTAGLDFTPIDKIHIMPNVWYTGYKNAGPSSIEDGYDLVYRLSIYYVYGK